MAGKNLKSQFALLFLPFLLFSCSNPPREETSNIEQSESSFSVETHNFSSWRIINEPTCEEMGRKERVCSICGRVEREDIPELGHTGGTATCTEQAICSRCGKAYGELAKHTYSSFELISNPTCTEEGVKTAVCSVCNAEIREYIPATGHKGEWYVVAEPRCFDDGEEQRLCTICDGLEERPIPQYGAHDLQKSTCANGQECSRCHYVKGTGSGHVYGEWIVTTRPTCKEEGEKERTCTICGNVNKAKVAKSDHIGTWLVETAATCVTAGSESRLCVQCGETFYRTLPATGHQGEWVIKKNETCTSNGEKERICTICGHKTVNTIYSHHDYSDWVEDKDSTCERTGEKHRICTKCGKVEKGAIPKKAHSGNWVMVVEPTCTENGAETRTCIVCGQSENRAVSKLGHQMQGGTCTSPSECTRCGHLVEGKHRFGEYQFIIESDCSRGGYNEATCQICGSIDRERFEPLGHQFGEWSVRKVATCQENGKNRRSCSTCGKLEDYKVEKTDHSGEWVILKEATCLEDGLKERVCGDCALDEKVVVPALGHDIHEASCIEPKGCSRCDAMDEGESLGGHLFGASGCDRCGKEYSDTADGVYYDYQSWAKSYTAYVSGKEGDSDILIRPTKGGYPVDGVKGSSRNGEKAKLKSISVPKSVTSVWGFAENSDIESIYFEEGSKAEIGGFENCSKLKTILLPDGLEEIADSSFSNCVSLKTILLPNSVTKIGDSAFSGCSSLKAIDLPTKLTSIGKYAFYGCESLSGNISFPGQIEDIGIYAFANTGSISPKFSEGITTLSVGLFQESKITDIELPDTLTEVSKRAFYGSALSKIAIPEGVRMIGDSAFAFCKSLSSIGLPSSAKEIESNAFMGCISLKSVSSFGGVEELYGGTFYGSGFETLRIPGTVKTIYGGAFGSCSELSFVTIEEGVTTIEMNAFADSSNLKTIVVPKSLTRFEAGALPVVDGRIVTDVYFLGTKEELTSLADWYSWYKESAFLYSEEAPTDSSFTYWHYVDGTPTKW